MKTEKIIKLFWVWGLIIFCLGFVGLVLNYQFPGINNWGFLQKTGAAIKPLESIVAQEIKRMSPGQILFNPPQEMIVGIKERVEVRMARGIDNTLTYKLRGRGAAVIEDIKVGPFMKVALKGDNFKIDQLSDQEQPIIKAEDGNFTQWEWDVTPLASGIHPLLIVVSVTIKVPNNPDINKDFPVFEKLIKVRVNPMLAGKSYFREYWQWIVATILMPLLLWYLNKKRKSYKKSKNNL